MAVYYVSSLASGSGDGSYESPWTLEEAAANAVAGDEVRIMADGTYLPSATIAPAAVGSAGAYVTYVGANSSGEVDGTRPLISGANLPANTDIFSFGTTAQQHFEFRDLEIANSPRHAIYSNLTVYGMLINCVIHDSVNSGCYALSSTSKFVIDRCYLYNNGVGLGNNNASRFSGSIVRNCMFANNTVGLLNGLACTIQSNLFLRNGYGIQANNYLTETTITNNVFYGSTNDAIKLNTAAGSRFNIISDNIFRSNGGYAINNYDSLSYRLYNNCFSNNTSGDTNLGTISGNGNIHEDPLFVSETLGSEDFRLQSTSPCKDAGRNPYGY